MTNIINAPKWKVTLALILLLPLVPIQWVWEKVRGKKGEKSPKQE